MGIYSNKNNISINILETKNNIFDLVFNENNTIHTY